MQDEPCDILENDESGSDKSNPFHSERESVSNAPEEEHHTKLELLKPLEKDRGILQKQKLISVVVDEISQEDDNSPTLPFG